MHGGDIYTAKHEGPVNGAARRIGQVAQSADTLRNSVNQLMGGFVSLVQRLEPVLDKGKLGGLAASVFLESTRPTESAPRVAQDAPSPVQMVRELDEIKFNINVANIALQSLLEALEL